MRVLILSIFVSLFSFLYANVVIGSVEIFKGNVKVKSEGSIKKNRVFKGLEILAGDLVTTSSRATAKIKLSDGSTIILDEKSSIHFKSLASAEQNAGKIYYQITSRNAKNSLKVKTPFAIIGIKGTTFIVSATKKPSVRLKEGLIGVSSIEEEFELYREKVQEEFNNYISQQQSAFEQYKNEQNKYKIAEPTKSFDLKAGHKISFYGQRVDENSWNEEDDKEFEHFEKLLEYMK